MQTKPRLNTDMHMTVVDKSRGHPRLHNCIYRSLPSRVTCIRLDHSLQLECL